MIRASFWSDFVEWISLDELSRNKDFTKYNK